MTRYLTVASGMLETMTRPMPSTEDLLRLAEASLSNAEALIDDAQVLADAGRFPRAHALATLACEEVGKSYQCVFAMMGAFTPKIFWGLFTDHQVKLSKVQALILESGEPIDFGRQYDDLVRNGSRSAHFRKLRGLYVDFADGTIQLPGDIGQSEAFEMIDTARTLLERERESCPLLVDSIQWLYSFDECGPAALTLFSLWLLVTHHDVAVSVMREARWGPHLTELLRNFTQELQQFNDLDDLVAQIASKLAKRA